MPWAPYSASLFPFSIAQITYYRYPCFSKIWVNVTSLLWRLTLVPVFADKEIWRGLLLLWKKVKSENSIWCLFCTSSYRGSFLTPSTAARAALPSSFLRNYTQHQTTIALNFCDLPWASVLYLDLFCASLSKMCSKVSEKNKKAHKDVTLSIKLDIMKHFSHGEWNKDIVSALNFESRMLKKISI